jgi:DNA-binding transcriptional LysR family regulator
MLNLKELQVFLSAANFGSFSEASRQLHLSQSAVSQLIGSLERQLGVRLFERTGRSTRLTAEGQALRPMARELLAAASRVEETILSMQQDVAGHLVVGCSTTSGKYLLPGLIASFRQLHPQSRIDVLVSSRSSVINRLLDGAVGLGVSSKRVENRELEYKKFFSDKIVMVTSAKHRWVRYRKILPDDLLDEPIILREDNAGTLDVVYEGLRRFDIAPEMLNVAMVLGNAEAICMAVEEGIGVAFVSRLAAARSLADGRLVEIKVEGLELQREIFIARNLNLPATRLQTSFWEFAQGGQAAMEERLENESVNLEV